METTPPPPAPADAPGLVDAFGRRHNNLRISVTDRCNIRCFYCMPEENPTYVPKAEVLSYEELLRFTRVAVGLGIDKIRLTGGEPLVRRDLEILVEGLLAIPGVRDLALTTNGILLAEQAERLYAAGLRRLNVHLDTLDAARFRQIARRDGLDRVLAGLDRAAELGFGPIKLNAVAVKGVIEPDLVPLARLGRERGWQVRFIEFMPLDADGRWRRDQVFTAEEILAVLGREIAPLEPAPGQDPRSPASEFVYADGVGRVGIIASVTRPFCHTCNRIRLTADGKLRNCLFALSELDVRAQLRSAEEPAALEAGLAALIRRSVGDKWEGHEINRATFQAPARPMHAIGG